MQHTIILVPFAIHKVFAKGSVMAAAQAAPVVVNGDEVVDLFLSCLAVEDALGEVEALDGEFDTEVQLVPPKPAGAETLQVDDQNIGSLPQIELLASSPMLLTAGAIPRVVL